MNVQKEQIAAMKMLPALTPLEALSVCAMLAFLEMESTVQVRFELLNYKIHSIMFTSLCQCEGHHTM